MIINSKIKKFYNEEIKLITNDNKLLSVFIRKKY